MFLNTKLIFLSLLLLMALNAVAGDSFGVGQKDFTFRDSLRGRVLAAHVWYPIDSKTKLESASRKGDFFLPVLAAKGAALVKAPQQFPLVLLSHGSGGKADKLFWIADYLVRNGNVVLAVDHPGNMTGDNSADGLMRVWDRPKDLSFALDELLKRPDFKQRLDLSKVAAVGHSAGGTTVLLLAGGRMSYDLFQSPVPDCVGTKDPYLAITCEQMKALDLKAYPKKFVEADYTDRRIRAIVALDPGFVRSFQRETLAHLNAKPYLFLAEKLNAPQDEIHSKEFLSIFPATSVEVVPHAFHMTFLVACKPDFPADDPELKELCINNDEKLKIQREVAQKTLTFFKNAW